MSKDEVVSYSEWCEASGQTPYPISFPKETPLGQLKSVEDGKEVSTAGRVMLRRQMGQLTFATLMDATGRMQLSFEADVLGQEKYDLLLKHLSLGDIVGVNGEIYRTKRGEPTIRVRRVEILSKALLPLPEKWKGLADPEIKARQRYLDLISSDESRDRFRTRFRMVSAIRHFLIQSDFVEVETPILQSEASGAMAKPFVTHHNALDTDFYLRIAPETFLKRVVVGGFDRVFELGRNFRNEGMSPAHLQEFTMLEFYAAYWDYRRNMSFVRDMLQDVIQQACGSLHVEVKGKTIDFSGEWEELDFTRLVHDYSGVDLDQTGYELDAIKQAIAAAHPEFDLAPYVSSATLIDSLYKRYCRPNIIGPAFLVHHPAPLIPLARTLPGQPEKLAMFQVLVDGLEVVKAYSELVDPIEQRKRLEEQAELAKKGEEETMMLEEDFLTAMEHAMPPMSGVGIGIDRLVTLLTNAASVRDVVLFPPMRRV